jgi:hypothetical protein
VRLLHGNVALDVDLDDRDDGMRLSIKFKYTTQWHRRVRRRRAGGPPGGRLGARWHARSGSLLVGYIQAALGFEPAARKGGCVPSG